MRSINFSTQLIELAKKLNKIGPDECITTIEVNKTDRSTVDTSLSISHFTNEGNVSKWDVVKETVGSINGIDVIIRYFEPERGRK